MRLSKVYLEQALVDLLLLDVLSRGKNNLLVDLKVRDRMNAELIAAIF